MNGADFVATGHYAQKSASGQLVQGSDKSKDQSYFLWTLTNDQLSKILFPIGGFQKSYVRKLAQKYNLPTATKKDSQGSCFIGEINMKEFLAHYIESKPGNVLDESGRVIGHHQGSLFYTLGERHGFVVTKKTDHDLPYYVVAKNTDENTITVSQHPSLFENSRESVITDCVFRTNPGSKKYSAQIRYHGEMKPCVLHLINPTEYTITFDEPDFSLSAGQSVVIYDQDICIGGGVVK